LTDAMILVELSHHKMLPASCITLQDKLLDPAGAGLSLTRPAVSVVADHL
jgi:hypothetical protein